MRPFHTFACLALAVVVIVPTAAWAAGKESVEDHNARMKWWREARFGMFIHWGLYAIPAGQWKGNTNHAEWIRHTAKIPIEVYDRFVGQFNPVKFDAEQWARMAKRAGMKYLVITSKHHDGFCLWDSKETAYDVMSTPFKRDILKELRAACTKQGVRLCFYHSIMDWHHPDYLPRRGWEAKDRPPAGADLARYIAHMKRQLTELVGAYDPGVLWFDGEWESTWTHEMGKDLYHYVRGLKPNIIINNRVDKGRRGMQGLTRKGDYCGDFGTPEQEIPHQGLPGVDWESCMTMNRHWGWNKNDKNWKSTEDLVRKLIDIASKGGNFLLNIGPKADGTFPEASIQRLKEIGQWMDVNGEAIYATTANPFSRLPWGRCTKTVRPGGATLYLHVFDWPSGGKLLVPGLRNPVKRAHLLANGTALNAAAVEDGVLLTVPSAALDPIATVIVLDVTGELRAEKLLPRQAEDGTMALTAPLCEIHDAGGGQTPQIETKYGKPSVGVWLDDRDWIEWAFTIHRPGQFVVTADMASTGTSRFTVKVAGRSLTVQTPNTGGYEKFKTVKLGEITIEKAGACRIELRPERGAWSPINVKVITLKP